MCAANVQGDPFAEWVCFALLYTDSHHRRVFIAVNSDVGWRKMAQRVETRVTGNSKFTSPKEAEEAQQRGSP